jgi:hypothetical protein
MLSENSIDKLVQPLVDRQENINNYVIGVIAKRVKEIGTMSKTDVKTLKSLLKSGSDVKQINKELAKHSNLQEKEIKSIIKTVASDTYNSLKPYYDYRHKSFIPLEKNKSLQNVVDTISTRTVGTYKNISKAQAFMIRDMKNPKVLKPTSIADTYQSVIDEAVQAVLLGNIDFNTAMRRTMKQLNESGIRQVTYQAESGRIHSQRLDTAVRRNMLEGIRAIRQGIEDEAGKQYGADGKEISVHDYPAPDHAPIQGHQFTNEEYEKLQNAEPFKDVRKVKFQSIQRAIGTLNCRHFTYSIIVGVTKPLYSTRELNTILRRNEEGYTLPNGKHLTMYECTQEQRRLETKIRQYKDGQIMAVEMGDTDLAKHFQTRISQYNKNYKSFSKACGLSIDKTRTTVSGYKMIN